MNRLTIVPFLAIYAVTCSAVESGRPARQDLVGAFAVAYDEFVVDIKKYSNDKGAVAEFLGDIRNYRVDLNLEGSSYTINFSPKEYAGVRMRGGGGTYLVDRETLQIIRFSPRK